MPFFRIHRLKDHLRQNFRSAPHLSGTASVKPRDYVTGGLTEAAEAIEASSPYAAFFALRGAETAVEVGDVLQCEDGSLLILKFVGIEIAEWIIPELKVDPSVLNESAAVAATA